MDLASTKNGKAIEGSAHQTGHADAPTPAIQGFYHLKISNQRYEVFLLNSSTCHLSLIQAPSPGYSPFVGSCPLIQRRWLHFIVLKPDRLLGLCSF